jgi:hypothetical protein
MKSLVSRGLAVLCLLALAPCAQALTITQQWTYGHSIYTSGQSPANIGRMQRYAPFDTTLGQLDSVTISVQTSARVGAIDVNYYNILSNPQAFELTQSVYLTMRFATDDGLSVAQVSDGSSGPKTLVQPTQSISHSADLSVQASATTTDPGFLARFSGYGTYPPAPVPGYVPQHDLFIEQFAGGAYYSWGGVSVQGATTLTITYNYHVPEDGYAGALLAVTAAGLSVIHRRRNRSLPGV